MRQFNSIFIDQGAAKIIVNEELTGQKLNHTIEEIILDKGKMQKMAENALKVSTTKVEDRIYQEVKKLVMGKGKGENA